MGFPVGYGDLLLPRFLLHALTILTILRKLISIMLNFVSLGHLLEPEISIQQEAMMSPENDESSIMLIQEMLPVVKFSKLIEPPEESCAVCLYDFDSEDDVRTLINCRHIFHTSCLDTWLFHHHKTCPLCRASFISEDMHQSLNQSLWMASSISEFYGDYSAVTTDL